jgi:hypothetical protein
VARDVGAHVLPRGEGGHVVVYYNRKFRLDKVRCKHRVMLSLSRQLSQHYRHALSTLHSSMTICASARPRAQTTGIRLDPPVQKYSPVPRPLPLSLAVLVVPIHSMTPGLPLFKCSIVQNRVLIQCDHSSPRVCYDTYLH